MIPEGVTQIGERAFDCCCSLTEITFAGTAPVIADDAFLSVSVTAYYPAGDPTWTADVMQNYGGAITWLPVGGVENRLYLNGDLFSGMTTVWIDGVEYDVADDKGIRYVDLPDSKARVMTVYEYHQGDGSDVHIRYPVSMKVWTLSNTDGFYMPTRQEDFDDILQYSGASIRVAGKKGIRMITSMEQVKKDALTTAGLAGFTLKEYGTAVAWAHQLGDNPLILGAPSVRSNYAYRKGVADPVFDIKGGLMQYTNVLVGFSNLQCSQDIAMRPYMILQNAEGEEITLYGGIVCRSIGYIACQNRNVFTPGTEEYEYIWGIIHSVYAGLYDDDYIEV